MVKPEDEAHAEIKSFSLLDFLHLKGLDK